EAVHSWADRMLFLIVRNRRLMLQREPDIVEAVEQTVSCKIVHSEGGGETLVIVNGQFFEIDRELIALGAMGALHEFGDLLFGKNYIEQAVFQAVVGKDVAERWSDDGAKTVIRQRPNSVFA